MNRFVRFLIWLLLLLVFLASVIFSFFHTDPVPLSLGYTTLAPQPLSVWVIGGFVLGGLIGVLLGAGLFRHLRSKLEIKRLQKRVAELEKQLNAAEAQAAEVAPPTAVETNPPVLAIPATPHRDDASAAPVCCYSCCC